MKLNRRSLRKLIMESVLSEGPFGDDVIDRMLKKVGVEDNPKPADVTKVADSFSDQDVITKAFADAAKTKDSNDAYAAIGTLSTIKAIFEENKAKIPGAISKSYRNLMSDLDDAKDILEQSDTTVSDLKSVMGGIVTAADDVEAALTANNIDIIYQNKNYTSEVFNMIAALANHPKINVQTPRQKRKQSKSDEKKKSGGKKRSGGTSLSDLRKLLNQMHEAQDSDIRIKEKGKWNSELEKSYQAAVGLYAPEHKGKSWQEVSKKVKQRGNLTGMYKWLSKLYGAHAIQRSGVRHRQTRDDASGSLNMAGKTIVKGGDSNIENIFNILSANANNKNINSTLKKQAQKFLDAGERGDNKKLKTYINSYVLGNGAGLDERRQKQVIEQLLKIYKPGVSPATFLKGTKGEKLYATNESLGLSRGSLYRRRYRRY